MKTVYIFDCLLHINNEQFKHQNINVMADNYNIASTNLHKYIERMTNVKLIEYTYKELLNVVI